VVDLAAVTPGGRIIIEKVPLTELNVVRGTPNEILPQKRLHVSEATSAADLLRRALQAYHERPLFGAEVIQGDFNFTWTTFGETYEQAAALVRALLSIGIPRGSFVGLCAHNSVAHAQALLALMLGGFVAVPLSMHLNADHARHIVQEARLRAVFVSPETLGRFKDIVASLPHGKHVHILNCLNGSPQELAEWAKQHDSRILSQALALPVVEVEVDQDAPACGGRLVAVVAHHPAA